jgi:cytoskeletal protein RodZ
VTLGQHLQNKRHETGRSLEQLAALTKIQLKILRAIEEDRYADLPAKAFTRGFIVNYAKALKLDPGSAGVPARLSVLRELTESLNRKPAP